MSTVTWTLWRSSTSCRQPHVPSNSMKSASSADGNGSVRGPFHRNSPCHVADKFSVKVDKFSTVSTAFSTAKEASTAALQHPRLVPRPCRLYSALQHFKFKCCREISTALQHFYSLQPLHHPSLVRSINREKRNVMYGLYEPHLCSEGWWRGCRL